MLMWPSAVGNTPVGMLVGWLLPACLGTSWSTSQRVAWKSSMNTCACSSELWIHWPSPDTSRSSSATMTPCAANRPAHRSATGIPTRTGPCPGSPVIDISPPIPWAIWSKPGRPL